MTKFSQILFLSFTYLSVISLIGCGDSTVGLVSGTVICDGKPLENAQVNFYPTPSGHASGGATDAQGVYELTYTADQQGAKVGEHVVTITSLIAPTANYSDDPAETEGAPEYRKELLPKKYRNRKSSELSATVKVGANVINFKLKGK